MMHKIVFAFAAALLFTPANGAGYAAAEMETFMSTSEVTGTLSVKEASYLGVYRYGAPDIKKENIPSFLYRFEVDGREQLLQIDNGVKDAAGEYGYPIQNRLKEGYRYQICLQGDMVVYVKEMPEEEAVDFTPPVAGVPGEKTVTNFLKTGLSATGTALYIFGGGWNWQDTGASIQARTIGVSKDWVKFFRQQDADFTFKERDGREENADPVHSFYPYGGYNEYYYAGLDCSGFVGWTVYNTLLNLDAEPGYVDNAVHMARKFADLGLGSWSKGITKEDGACDLRPGDIVSTGGHIWISLGTCRDGSVLALHSTPANSRTGQPGGGVELSAVGTDEGCEAFLLADTYMARYYPAWYERYPIKLCDPKVYFDFEKEEAGRFTWGTDPDAARQDLNSAVKADVAKRDSNPAVTDPDGLQSMTPEEALRFLFGEGRHE